MSINLSICLLHHRPLVWEIGKNLGNYDFLWYPSKKFYQTTSKPLSNLLFLLPTFLLPLILFMFLDNISKEFVFFSSHDVSQIFQLSYFYFIKNSLLYFMVFQCGWIWELQVLWMKYCKMANVLKTSYKTYVVFQLVRILAHWK